MKRYTAALMTAILLCLLLCGGCTAVLYATANQLFWVPLAVFLCLFVCCVFIAWRLRNVCTGWIMRLAKKIAPEHQRALDIFPLPLLLMDREGHVLFTNKLFQSQVTMGRTPLVDTPIEELFDGAAVADIVNNPYVDLCCNARRYTAYVSTLREEHGTQYLLYLTDDTDLKVAADEYEASRPVVMQICIDNLEEATERLRAGDRARIAGTVEVMLEDWIAADGGVLQKYSNDRFMAVTEHRYLSAMTEDRFSVLNRIRQGFPEIGGSITLSIGVGEGDTIDEGRRMAIQALDMALSRGGDQVAVKTLNGYDFYGGQSGGVERRTRVRSRIIADALRELIVSSDRVLVMGHRSSDLDCLGSGVGLVSAVRQMQIPAAVVVNRSTTLAGKLLETYDNAGKEDWFIEPDIAERVITKNTLLVIVDTHSADMLESPALYKKAERVTLIDHHRRKETYLKDTVLTYQESKSSSASEMVAELLPYLSTESCGRMEAEALLAGIMLDTRNFVINTGVRTFEAAAYLRSLGAETVAVKGLFTENLKVYHAKNKIVGNAQLYRNTAISVAEEDMRDLRVAVAQAADELLSVSGVQASFVVSAVGEDVYISARSYGAYNVQVIMESLGGGGHLTMAATQLKSITAQDAVKELKAAIDRYAN